MPIDFQETGNAAVCAAAAFCSTRTLNAERHTRTAEEGGTAGGADILTIDGSASNRLAIWFEIDPNDAYTWPAGDYTVRLNVTTANMNLTWDELYICRVNSGCTNQATIASQAVLGIGLGTTGVKSVTLAGAAQSPAAGDKVMCLLTFVNGSTMTMDLGWTSDQLITTPLEAAAAVNAYVFRGGRGQQDRIFIGS